MAVEFWGRNRPVVTLLLAIFLLIILLSFSARETGVATWPERALHRLAAPVQRFLVLVASFSREVVEAVWELRTLRRENERLRQEVDEITFRYQNIVEAKLELDRVRALLAYSEEEAELDLMMARVISRGLTGWHQEIGIDRGRIHGVQAGDAVVTYRGAVGRVIEISGTSARVLLITDPRSAVAAMVQNGRDGALAEGDSSRLGGIRLARLPWDFPIAVGDQVITSRIGAVFPHNHVFAIGKVSEIVVSAGGLLKLAHIQPAVDFSRLEEVLVIRRGHP